MILSYVFDQQVQSFMRQVVARKVVVHACGGLITLNLSLITTVRRTNRCKRGLVEHPLP